MGWRYVLTDDELLEHLGSMSCAYGRWDRSFMSWIVGKGGVRGRLAPRWPIVSEDGTPLARHSVRNAAAGQFTWPGVQWLGDEATAAAEVATAYVELIPVELRWAVAPLADAQWMALEMAQAVPAFGWMLVDERRTSGLRFVEACFSFASPEHMRPEQRVQLASAIAHERRRPLLERLSGVPWRAAAVRALARLEGPWQPSELVELAEAFADPRRARTLGHMAAIPGEALGSRIIKPGTLGDDRTALRVLDWRGQGLPPISDELARRIGASLRSATSDEQLLRLADKWRARVLRSAPFPPPPFAGDEMLQPLTSAAAMEEEGRVMRNCLASLVPRVLSGEAYYYRWMGVEWMTVETTSTGDGEWVLGAVEAERGTAARPVQREQVVRWVEATASMQASARAVLRSGELGLGATSDALKPAAAARPS